MASTRYIPQLDFGPKDPLGPTPNEMKVVTTGAAATTMLPAIREEMDKIERGVIGRVLGLLKQNKLSPDMALDAWREIEMARRMVKSFETRSVVGASTAKEYEDYLKLESKEQ